MRKIPSVPMERARGTGPSGRRVVASRRSVVRLVAPMILIALLVSCRSEPSLPLHRGPVILITIDTLRSDVVGALGGPAGLTPNLDRLAAESEWVAPAVSTSSWTVPSMASIFTGLQPWRHGNWHAERATLREDLLTLPELIKAAGFRTTGYRSNTWLRPRFGYSQGFDAFHNLGQLKRAVAHLESLPGDAEFVWAHILPPHAPYVRYDEFVDRVQTSASELPPRVVTSELEQFYDPERALSEDERETFWAMYQMNVAHSDRLLGRLLDALRRSGQFDNSLVIVTSDHGEEFGERGQIAHGGSLDRVLIEVPLIVKLPTAQQGRLQPRPWVSNARIFATIAESVGLEASEIETSESASGSHGDLIAPSLFLSPEDSGPDEAALAELYLGNGTNSFSMVEEGRQVILDSRFQPNEPEYFLARRASFDESLVETMSESPEDLFERVTRSFLVTPPLSGNSDHRPEFELVDWSPESEESARGGAQDGDGSAGAREVRRLRAEWLRRNGEEKEPGEVLGGDQQQLTPEERERLRSLGYVAG